MPSPSIFDLWTVYVVLAALPLMAGVLAVYGLVRLGRP